MDNISELVFQELVPEQVAETPSLLTVILEVTPKLWYAIRNQITLQDLTKALLVFLNAHLSANNSNQVAFVVSLPAGSRFLYPNSDEKRMLDGNTPNTNKNTDTDNNTDKSIDKSIDTNTAESAGENTGENSSSEGLPFLGMYRQFRIVDEAVVSELNRELTKLAQTDDDSNASTLSGALSMTLTYTNRMLHFDQSIETTAASAINSTTNVSSLATEGAHGSNTAGTTSMDLRVLVITANDTYHNNYIAVMNLIFAAQKMKVPIDIVKLGARDSAYLQQAADATSGVYLHITEPEGLIQTLATAYFIEPCLRGMVILPTKADVDYKASCFLTGKPVDVGYVCSVCLCIMSKVPETKCPTCHSLFDANLLARLKQGPVIRKKRKVEERGETKVPTRGEVPQQ